MGTTFSIPGHHVIAVNGVLLGVRLCNVCCSICKITRICITSRIRNNALLPCTMPLDSIMYETGFSFSYHTCIYVHITNLHPPHYSSLEALKLSNGCTHLQILMNVGQHLETVNTDVEIHWDHTSATAMKDIHCNRINAKVSLLKIQLILQRHVQDDKQSSSQILYVE